MLSRAQHMARVAREVAGKRVLFGPTVPEDLRTQVEASSDGAPEVLLIGADEISARGELALNGVGPITPTPDGILVVAVLQHNRADGSPRIVECCSDATPGWRAAHRIITDMAVLDVTVDGLLLREVAPTTSALEVQARTGTRLLAGPDLAVMEPSKEGSQ